MRKYLLFRDNGEDFQVGLDARKALETIDRHNHAPLPDAVRDKDGALTGGRLWIAAQLRERYGKDYVR